MCCGDTYFFVKLVSLYVKQLTVSSCDYRFDVSNIAVGWVRVTTLYVICVLFCFSCVNLLWTMLTKFETKSARVKGLSFHPKRPWVLARYGAVFFRLSMEM
jgi:hypothetical protein